MNDPGRECGGCTACCKALSVAELAKPSNRWCNHCDVGSGCTVYADRPKSCRDFNCLWRAGALGDADRPDRIKCVFWTPSESWRLHGGKREQLLMAAEPAPGMALNDPRASSIIAGALRSGIPVVLMCGEDHRALKLDGLGRPVTDFTFRCPDFKKLTVRITVRGAEVEELGWTDEAVAAGMGAAAVDGRVN